MDEWVPKLNIPPYRLWHRKSGFNFLKIRRPTNVSFHFIQSKQRIHHWTKNEQQVKRRNNVIILNKNQIINTILFTVCTISLFINLHVYVHTYWLKWCLYGQIMSSTCNSGVSESESWWCNNVSRWWNKWKECNRKSNNNNNTNNTNSHWNMSCTYSWKLLKWNL